MSEISDTLINVTMSYFEDRMSTADMAKRLPFYSEADFERALHLGLERRRVQRVAEQMKENA